MYAGQHAIDHPDRPAFIMAATGERVTYAELEARTNRLAHLLRAHGQRLRPSRAAECDPRHAAGIRHNCGG